MDNSKKIILDLCGGSGSWSQPYRDAGYDVKIITLPKYDVRDFALLPGDNIYGILAAPPCTEFSIAKNHDLKRDFEAGMEIVNACLRIIKSCKPKFWALENPAGFLTSHIGKSKSSFQPWWFGDGWSKRTMLWGDFNMPERKYKKFTDCPQLPGLYVRPGRKVPSIAFCHLRAHSKFIPQLKPFLKHCEQFPGRQKDGAFRAIASPAFAKAFFKANQ